jgi:hypothetical protein
MLLQLHGILTQVHEVVLFGIVVLVVLSGLVLMVVEDARELFGHKRSR